MKSWNAWLAEFKLGERRYVETDLRSYAQCMRTINTPRSRRPATLDGRSFTTNLYTAIGAGSAGDVRYLICVERTA